MPEPQRSKALQILGEVAAEYGIPSAIIVSHEAFSKENRLREVRVVACRRMYHEIRGVSILMLARAWKRDKKRISSMVRGEEEEDAKEHPTI